MSFQLVKMEGDYVLPPRSWNIVRRFLNWKQGKKVMPVNPVGHPDCIEIIEGDEVSSKVVYRKDQ